MATNNAANFGTGTIGQVLTSNGTGVAPTFQNSSASGFSTIKSQVFTSSGTYTPTTNMKYCIVEVVGGGGGSGGIAATGATTVAATSGGGAGGYARKVFSAATIGVSQTVTIGAGGAAGSAGNNAGSNGGTTTFGALMSATGGAGTTGGAAVTATSNFGGIGGAGGVGSGGDVNTDGGLGISQFAFYTATTGAVWLNGTGGNIYFGTTYGAGGEGSANTNQIAQSGNAGDAGIVIITEFI
jgi:hypothetical protein